MQGNGGDVPFTIDDLSPSLDYRIQVQTKNNPDGYWGGEIGNVASGPVGWFEATQIDLTHGNVDGVYFQLAVGYKLTVTITGINIGDLFEIVAWSASTDGFDWKQVSAMESNVQVILSGLPTADDYIISIDSQTDGVRSGFYSGENQTPGPFLKAARISLTGDQSITLTASGGYSISGSLSNLEEGNVAWIEAWSEETLEQGEVKIVANGSYTLKGLASARDYEVCVETDEQSGGCYGSSSRKKKTAKSTSYT